MRAFATKQKPVEVSAMWKGQTSAILFLDISRKAVVAVWCDVEMGIRER
jgi:hypothetical protein